MVAKPRPRAADARWQGRFAAQSRRLVAWDDDVPTMAAARDDEDPWAPLPASVLWGDRAGDVAAARQPPSQGADWTPPPPLPRRPLPAGPTGLPTGGPPPREGYCAPTSGPDADQPAAEAAVDPETAAATAEWFLRLPPAEQERLRAQWQQRRDSGGSRVRTQGRQRNRRFVAALACSVATIFAGTGALWHATLGAGICTGIWWRSTSPDRFADPLGAMACLFACHALARWASGSDGHPLAWVDLCVIVACATMIGFDGEIRRTGGFDQK